MRIATTGAALSGNKGAASMIEALARWAEHDGSRVALLTTYPDEDRALVRSNTDVVGLGPVGLVARDVPLAALSALGPARWRRHLIELSPALTAIDDADVVADISGVSFSDDRGPKFNIYNALLTVLPVLLGTPLVKCSQAVGPFEQRSNRWLAKLLLPRASRILSRGAYTDERLRELGLDNVERADDLAFTLPHDGALPNEVDTAFDSLGGAGVFVVMPSAVVESWCERHDIDHTAVFTDLIANACDRHGVGVMLVPHAYRASGLPRRMDDARVCRAIARRLGQRSDVVVIDRDLTPIELRAVVQRCDLLVASRFHGMINGLATATPTLVVGWGHKYREVLDLFGAAGDAFDYAALRSPDTIARAIDEMWTSRAERATGLRESLGPVARSARRNFEVLAEIGRGSP
jgi:colanic acid/amylovoran biosynthesis protein